VQKYNEFEPMFIRAWAFRGALALAGVTLASGPAAAQTQSATAQASAEVRLQEDAPLRYTVKKGDTLWGISKKFLKDPYQWPEVWTPNNVKVTNPHLIYPGQELLLVYKNRRPQIVPSGNISAENRTEKLSPQMRESSIDEAIPTIPIDAIREFLRGPRVVSKDEINGAPYIVDFNEDVIEGAEGLSAYIKNIKEPVLSGYTVVRLGKKYEDPETGEDLGIEAIPTAEAEVREVGKLTKVALVESVREVHAGDRLLPQESGLFEANFYPHPPAGPVGGRIISVFDALTQTGQYKIVTINRGTRQGLEPGHVLSILQAGRRVKDPYGGGRVQLPDEYAGMLMIFKVGPKVSYGLVMEATHPIHLLDKVEKPRPGEKE
jgi:LysM repeat protein